MELISPKWPLLPILRLAHQAERIFEWVAQMPSPDQHDPEKIWRKFRAERRNSSQFALRALARMDEAYRTDVPEYLDRSDVSAHRREGIVRALDQTHRILGTYPRLNRLLVPIVRDVRAPRILEVASGHGQLAITLEKILAARGICAAVTGSDLSPELVALAQRNADAAHSAVNFKCLNAMRLDISDDSFDLVFNALSMHHLPFGGVVSALKEMRRVSKRAVVFDLWRSPLLFAPAAMAMLAFSLSLDCTHDGIISMRKAWGVDDWCLAAELAGWPVISIGLFLPSFVFIRLER